MINTATKIIMESIFQPLLEMIYEDDDLPEHSGEDVKFFCEETFEENCDEYDEDYYPIMAIQSAKNSVDWDYLAKYLNTYHRLDTNLSREEAELQTGWLVN